jgi:predicted alpha/beta-fold hydrolase
VYERYFMMKWRRSLRIKAGLFPQRYDFGDLKRFRGLRDMTEFFVCDFSEYKDLASYLAGYAITGDALTSVTAPTLLVAAQDDPVIPAGDLPRLARPESLRVVATTRGGHCGFLPSAFGHSWIDGLMREWFAEAEAKR